MESHLFVNPPIPVGAALSLPTGRPVWPPAALEPTEGVPYMICGNSLFDKAMALL